MIIYIYNTINAMYYSIIHKWHMQYLQVYAIYIKDTITQSQESLSRTFKLIDNGFSNHSKLQRTFSKQLNISLNLC